MKEIFLTPIDVPKPPHHTQIQVRCFTCKHFPVCLIKKDYLKTAILIEGILCNPQKDYIATEKEIIDTYKNDIIIPHGDTKYIKFIIKNEDGSTYTPEQGDSVRFAMKKNKTDEEPKMYQFGYSNAILAKLMLSLRQLKMRFQTI